MKQLASVIVKSTQKTAIQLKHNALNTLKATSYYTRYVNVQNYTQCMIDSGS